MFYAVEYAYGKTTINHGQRPNIVRAFASRAHRDAWVQERTTEYITDNDYREDIPSTHYYVKGWKRAARTSRVVAIYDGALARTFDKE